MVSVIADLALPVSEVFGPTLQGEGPHAGRLVKFIRLGGCNLSCTWCDTPYTWDSSRFNIKAENPMTRITDIVDRLGECHTVVISGGEPLMHQSKLAWSELLNALAERGIYVHVETNGTLLPNDITRCHVEHYSISPKLPNAGTHKPSQNPALAQGWSDVPGAKVVKFVCRDLADAVAGVYLADSNGFGRHTVWLMPEGRTPEELAGRWPVVADAAVKLGVNATHRLHVLAWGDTKGT